MDPETATRLTQLVTTVAELVPSVQIIAAGVAEHQRLINSLATASQNHDTILNRVGEGLSDLAADTGTSANIVPRRKDLRLDTYNGESETEFPRWEFHCEMQLAEANATVRISSP